MLEQQEYKLITLLDIPFLVALSQFLQANETVIRTTKF